MTTDRVMIFIDGSNLFHACKEVRRRYRFNFEIDFLKLITILIGERKLIRPYYYGSYDPENPNDKQLKFYKFLEHVGFDVKIKPLRKRGDKKIEKGVDVALAVDMLTLAFRDGYDTAILVSGDGDFIPLIEKVKEQGKRVEVAMFKDFINDNLKRKADKFIELDKYMDEISK